VLLDSNTSLVCYLNSNWRTYRLQIGGDKSVQIHVGLFRHILDDLSLPFVRLRDELVRNANRGTQSYPGNNLLGCSKEHFRYIGVRSIALAGGDNAKLR
jgi:hypothetical protein